MTTEQRLAGCREIAHALEAENTRLQRLLDNKEARIDAMRDRLGTQSAFIMKVLGLLSKHAPDTLIKELVEEAAQTANGAAKLRGLSLHIAQPRKQEML